MTAAGPPEPPSERGSGNDPFGWLYRRGETAPTEDSPPIVPPTVESPRAAAPPPPTYPTPPPAQPTPPPAPVTQPAIQPVPPPAPYAQPVAPPVGPPPTYQPPPYVPPSEPPRRRGVVAGVVVGVIVLAAIGAGVVAAFMLRSPDRQVALDPATSAPSQSTTAPRVAPVASGVSADCTAPSATDDAGKPVSYAAANVLDTQSSTAWRCDGNGVGRALTFTFPAGSTISRVGLINGYAKTDPKSGAKRYGEYRRITRATWTFDDGTVVTQKLSDGVQKAQTVTVPSIEGRTVKLTIVASTAPGGKAKSRDAVLISAVTFG